MKTGYIGPDNSPASRWATEGAVYYTTDGSTPSGSFGVASGNSTAVAFTGTGPYMFTSDGSLIDSNGDVANGTIFIGIAGQVDTARAITVYGVTGLMRTWKWQGNAWFD